MHDDGLGHVRAERTVMLTDAVTAIAMTLLILPLVEVAPEVLDAGVGSLLTDDLGLLISFVVSFLVIYLFWSAHRTVYAGLEQQSNALGMLNLLWLLGIVFLPFPTALVGRDASPSTTPLYLGTMTALAVVTSAMTQVAASGAGSGAHAEALRRRAVVWWLSCVVFIVCTGVAVVAPDAALYALLVLVPVRVIGVRWADAGATTTLSA